MKPGDRVRLAVKDHPGVGRGGFHVRDYDGQEGTVRRIEGRGPFALVTVSVRDHWLYLDRGSVVRVAR